MKDQMAAAALIFGICIIIPYLIFTSVYNHLTTHPPVVGTYSFRDATAPDGVVLEKAEVNSDNTITFFLRYSKYDTLHCPARGDRSAETFGEGLEADFSDDTAYPKPIGWECNGHAGKQLNTSIAWGQFPNNKRFGKTFRILEFDDHWKVNLKKDTALYYSYG